MLTKRMAEDLTEYMHEQGIRVRYMHSDIETLERIEIIRDLRLGAFDVLIGINLLREGLDIPECALVAILDADKEGFLRSETCLIQTIGRAARNVDGKVILYADQMTGSMERAIAETDRRREKQTAWNAANGITPESIKRNIPTCCPRVYEQDHVTVDAGLAEDGNALIGHNLEAVIAGLEKKMREAAADLEFETAARLRDEIKRLRETELAIADDPLARQTDVEDKAGAFAGDRKYGGAPRARGQTPSPRKSPRERSGVEGSDATAAPASSASTSPCSPPSRRPRPCPAPAPASPRSTTWARHRPPRASRDADAVSRIRKPALDEMGSARNRPIPARAPDVDPRTKAGAYGEQIRARTSPPSTRWAPTPSAACPSPASRVPPKPPMKTIDVPDEREKKSTATAAPAKPAARGRRTIIRRLIRPSRAAISVEHLMEQAGSIGP